MTSLTRPVKRETAVVVKGRPLIAEFHAGYMILREKGRRFSVTVDYRAAMDLGFRILARQEAAEKAKARKTRRTDR